jgi:putative effector of murein hydrolase
MDRQSLDELMNKYTGILSTMLIFSFLSILFLYNTEPLVVNLLVVSTIIVVIIMLHHMVYLKN